MIGFIVVNIAVAGVLYLGFRKVLSRYRFAGNAGLAVGASLLIVSLGNLIIGLLNHPGFDGDLML